MSPMYTYDRRYNQGKAQIYGCVYYYYLSILAQIYGCVYYYYLSIDLHETDRECTRLTKCLKTAGGP